MIPFVIQGENIVLYVDNAPVIIDASHLNYKLVKQALIDKDFDRVRELSTVKKAVTQASGGRAQFVDGVVMFDGEEMHNALSTRMIKMFQEGFDIDPMLTFIERLDSNPSYRARQELFGFLDACTLPITDDGCFLAYKKITKDWKDCYTNTIDNSIGAVVTMPRRDVNENPNETCSAGLHVCSYSYLNSYSGDRVVAVKVDPADVVSVPTDYNNAKMRVCKYEVVEELEMRAASDNDVLSQSGPVREGFSKKSTTKFKVEYVLKHLSDKDWLLLCDHLQAKPEEYWESCDLLEGYTFSELRAAIIELNLV